MMIIYTLLLLSVVGPLYAGATRQEDIAHQVTLIAQEKGLPDALQFGLSMCAADVALTSIGTIVGSALFSGLLTEVGGAILTGKTVQGAVRGFFDTFSQHLARQMGILKVTVAELDEALNEGGAIAAAATRGETILKIGDQFIEPGIGGNIALALQKSGEKLTTGASFRLTSAIKDEIGTGLQNLLEAKLENVLRGTGEGLAVAQEAAAKVPSIIEDYLKNEANLARLLVAGGSESQAADILRDLTSQLTKQAKGIAQDATQVIRAPKPAHASVIGLFPQEGTQEVGAAVSPVVEEAETGTVKVVTKGPAKRPGLTGVFEQPAQQTVPATPVGEVTVSAAPGKINLGLISEETATEKLQNALKQIQSDAEFRKEFQNIIKESSVIKLTKINASKLSYAVKLATTGGTVIDLAQSLGTGPSAANACYKEMATRLGLTIPDNELGAFAHLYIHNNTDKGLQVIIYYPLSQDVYDIAPREGKRVYAINWGKHITNMVIRSPGMQDLVLEKNLVPYAKELISAEIGINRLSPNKFVASQLRGVKLKGT